jgi:transposase-like protein
MARRSVSRLRYVAGPDGTTFTLADLPSPKTRRWVARRKAEVIAAVSGGLLSLDDACKRYGLTIDEYLSWYRQVSRHGLAGLRATKIRDYRNR